MNQDDILRFTKTLAGIYDNFTQAQENPKDFARIHIVFRPLPWSIFQGPGFYSEQYYDYAPWDPYRQGIHRLRVENERYVMENFGFANKERLAGAGRTPELLEAIDAQNLEPRCGCSMHFIESKPGHYIGNVEPGKKCLVPRDGNLTYLVSEVEVDQDTWISRDRGFDPQTDEPKWGSEHGPLRFARVQTISELITPNWAKIIQ